MSDLSESQIRSFQQARGLDVTGYVDAVTARAMEEARWKLGDRSLYLQEPPSMRGDDVATLQAVKAFQTKNKLDADGIVGPKTFGKLGIE